jgi:hypothetical protein
VKHMRASEAEIARKVNGTYHTFDETIVVLFKGRIRLVVYTRQCGRKSIVSGKNRDCLKTETNKRPKTSVVSSLTRSQSPCICRLG